MPIIIFDTILYIFSKIRIFKILYVLNRSIYLENSTILLFLSIGMMKNEQVNKFNNTLFFATPPTINVVQEDLLRLSAPVDRAFKVIATFCIR